MIVIGMISYLSLSLCHGIVVTVIARGFRPCSLDPS